MKAFLWFCLVASFFALPFIVACSGNAQPTISVAAVSTQAAQIIFATLTAQVPTATITPAVTDTLSPTNTSAPTDTPRPTDTPEPTDTPKPTDTPRPTNTPYPTPTKTPLPMPTLTARELDERLAAQPLIVVRTRYIVQSTEYKALYPDMLSAVVRNNGKQDIRDIVLAFVAWDANGLPVLLKGNIDFSEGAYVKKAKATGINLVPGDEWGEGKGFAIAEGLNIKSFAAVVVSFTTFDNEVWENEYFDEWRALYEGKRRPN